MIVSILLAENLPRHFSYQWPQGQSPVRGQLVKVPFGKREGFGVVLGPSTENIAPERLKVAAPLTDVPPLKETLLEFITWVADYSMTTQGAVLSMALGGTKIVEPIKRAKKETAQPHMTAHTPTLSPAQQEVANQLSADVQAEKFQATLLDGVTGSGKTEVYCEAIATALKKNKQALLLLPEISLTTQLYERLEKRFGFAPLLWHSHLSLGKKKQIWRTIAGGTAPLVIGARSALFLPFANLGMIIVDEEHDTSYKQEDGVIYHARDMAVVRAKIEKIPVILCSATPSLESMVNVKAGRYRLTHLPERHGVAVLPKIHLVDLKKEKLARQSWLSPSLQQAIKTALERGEQSLLFLNRRGYAPLTLCRACGARMQCPQCSAWLIEHRMAGKHRLNCHHCDYTAPYPQRCPHCKAEDKLTACGPGIERLAEEVTRLFPHARRAILASDTQTGLQAVHEVVNDMQNGKIDILIGTQMSAKGYHFPKLTVVGVVDGDLGLQGGDLRAAERTFQLLYQVAGRCGRADDKGHVYIQTVQPDHAVMQCLATHNRDRLLAILANDRAQYHMPPFARLATLTISGTDLKAVENFCATLARNIQPHEHIKIYGPAPAPLALLRGRHRMRFLLNAPRGEKLQSHIEHWITLVKTPRSLRLVIDVDPQSFV